MKLETGRTRPCSIHKRHTNRTNAHTHTRTRTLHIKKKATFPNYVWKEFTNIAEQTVTSPCYIVSEDHSISKQLIIYLLRLRRF